MNITKTVIAAALVALTGIASASTGDNDNTQSILTCGVDGAGRHAMSAFKPSAGMTEAQLQAFFVSAKCVDEPVHPGVAGSFQSGARYEPVSEQAPRLMRLIDADGKVVGDAAYRFTLMPMGGNFGS